MTDIEKHWPPVEAFCNLSDEMRFRLTRREYGQARAAILKVKELEEKNRKLGIMAEMGWLTARALLIKPNQDCTGVIKDSLKKIEDLKS